MSVNNDTSRIYSLPILEKKIEKTETNIEHLTGALGHRKTHGGKNYRTRQISLNNQINSASKNLTLLNNQANQARQLDNISTSKPQLVNEKDHAPEEPSGWPTWQKVALVGVGVLAAGAILYWWWNTGSTPSAGNTPSTFEKIRDAATATPSKVLGAATATASQVVDNDKSITTQLFEAYLKCHDKVRFELKEHGRSLNWCVRHGHITEELKNWIIANGKLKKHW
jgi:hypothetical protein